MRSEAAVELHHVVDAFALVVHHPQTNETWDSFDLEESLDVLWRANTDAYAQVLAGATKPMRGKLILLLDDRELEALGRPT